MCRALVSKVLYAGEKLTACCLCFSLMLCITSTVIFTIGFGVGLGYNYCFVEYKSIRQSNKTSSPDVRLHNDKPIYPFPPHRYPSTYYYPPSYSYKITTATTMNTTTESTTTLSSKPSETLSVESTDLSMAPSTNVSKPPDRESETQSSKISVKVSDIILKLFDTATKTSPIPPTPELSFTSPSRTPSTSPFTTTHVAEKLVRFGDTYLEEDRFYPQEGIYYDLHVRSTLGGEPSRTPRRNLKPGIKVNRRKTQGDIVLNTLQFILGNKDKDTFKRDQTTEGSNDTYYDSQDGLREIMSENFTDKNALISNVFNETKPSHISIYAPKYKSYYFKRKENVNVNDLAKANEKIISNRNRNAVPASNIDLLGLLSKLASENKNYTIQIVL